MSASRSHPRRRLRSEVFPLAVILSLPLAIYLAFPSGAVGFNPSCSVSAKTITNAFILLDADREASLLASARASWQSDSASRRGIRADLLACGFSEYDSRIASGLRPPVVERMSPVTDYDIDAVPHGVGAAPPAVLPAEEPGSSDPLLPRSELLKLN